MGGEKECLESSGPQYQPLQKLQVEDFDPTKHGRPSTGCVVGAKIGNRFPVFSRPLMMLDVVAVVEKRDIVQNAVVTRCAAGVFKVSVNVTECEPDGVARTIYG